MKQANRLVVAVLVLVLGGVAGAAQKGGAAKKAPKVRAVGMLAKVVGVEGKTLKVEAGKVGEKAATMDVATDSGTVVTLDGQAAQLGDLKAGMAVRVIQANGVATRLEAETKPAGKGAGGNKAKGA